MEKLSPHRNGAEEHAEGDRLVHTNDLDQICGGDVKDGVHQHVKLSKEYIVKSALVSLVWVHSSQIHYC